MKGIDHFGDINEVGALYEEDLQERGRGLYLTQDRDWCLALVNTVMNLRVL